MRQRFAPGRPAWPAFPGENYLLLDTPPTANALDFLDAPERLTEALGRAEAAVRSLRYDLADLLLLPTEDDIAALHADGYLAQAQKRLSR